MIPEGFIWHTYLQLAQAIAFLHDGYDPRNGDCRPPPNHRPIIHRDIKPGNIFLRNPKSGRYYPNIVLADFGLATTKLHSCQNLNDLCGTPHFQGPEIPIHSRAGDCWAIGAVIHHMCIGGPPIRRPPPDMDPRYWATCPEARKIIRVGKRGYSRYLERALKLVLLSDPRERVRGGELVEAIHCLIEKWEERGGEHFLLEPWALGR